MDWTPNAFNLRSGNPFEYSEHSISSESGTEAFESRVKTRDANTCVVCGVTEPRALKYCHIIPKDEDDTWEEMKEYGFLPAKAKSVEHEARNAIRLCRIHQKLFDAHRFYIRWMPEERRFVFINHSQDVKLEVFHGRAINLHADNDRVPFHGAFLFHEMQVRGYWPLREDRAIPLPIRWIDWIDEGGDGHGGDAGGDRGGHGGHPGRGGGRGRRGRGGRGRGRGRGRGGGSNGSGGDGHNQGPGKNARHPRGDPRSGRFLRSQGPVPISSAS